MAKKKRARRPHWLNDPLWKLTVGDWIAILLVFTAIVVLFCLFMIRRHTLPHHLDHTFAVSDPEFVGSALALSDPVLLPGNKVVRLDNGDKFFPAMLGAIGSAQKSVNFEAFIFYSDATGLQFRDALCNAAQRGIE